MTSTIYITTPCMNARAFIDRTIISVVSQAGEFSIRYHVKDGGSDDGTVERLAWWEKHLKSGILPLQCEGIDFSWSTTPDVGMYDAILQGYAEMNIADQEFMTWINADDILMPGACAFVADVANQFEVNQVSWLGGAACILNRDRPVTTYDRFIPSEVIRAGACDGHHWHFVQQEGTFYRCWLWRAADPGNTIRTMKVGGDWNLWRLFAQRSSLIQWRSPLAAFRIREGQLSARHRDVYESEMDEVVAKDKRLEFLQELGKKGLVSRRKFASRYPDGALEVIEETKHWPLAEQTRKVFGKDLSPTIRDKGEKSLFAGTPPMPDPLDIQDVVRQEGNVFVYDHEWQFPAITEQHAYFRVRDALAVPDGVTYVAFPWATLIDKLQVRTKDALVYLNRFRRFCELLPKDTIKVTVCQQIKMRRFMNLFELAGIDHIFWTHATHEDAADAKAGTGTPAVHPFPLYPVQIRQALPGAAHDADGVVRPQLFSFVGARADQYYPMQTRNQILDNLAADKRGYVAGRLGWFYNKVVYDHQVRGSARDVAPETLIEQDNAAQFRAMLEQSTFSLCPAGTGPNSIRLWESLGAGAIPVILADTWAPPGNRKLWEAAAVFRPETEAAVRALPDELEDMARDPELLAAKRQAMRQLWLIYGPDGFVHDIHILMQALGRDGGEHDPAPLDRIGASLVDTETLDAPRARMVLIELSGALLIDPKLKQNLGIARHPMARLAERAIAALTPNDAARQHFERVIAARLPTRAMPAMPALGRGGLPRIHRFGAHSHRTPVSYPAFLREIPGRLTMVDDPAHADLLLTGFNRDFLEGAAAIKGLTDARPDLKLLVLSEEPLWDVHWSGGYTATERKLSNGIPYRFLNHENSPIFDFRNLPYFPLTDDDMLAAYALRFRTNAGMTPADLLAQWQAAPIPAAFFAEARSGAMYQKAFPDDNIWGLCAFRTEVAQHNRAARPEVMCVGKGWREQVRRQELPNWHLDKIATLSGRTRVCSAIENVHQYRYVSEKVFDAFAVGAVPAYYATPTHRVFEFVAPEAMINLVGLDAEAAAERILSFEPDLPMAEAWLETVNRLAEKFGDIASIRDERRRFAEASLAAILDLVEA